MDIITIAISVFIFLEILNVGILYFFPDTKKGNGVGVFNVYKKIKNDPEVYEFVKYLINWIAGTKLIFIALLIVILITGSETTKVFSLVALILTILTFYWRLYPAIRKMDEMGQITPASYSKTLGIMIGVFIGIFIGALCI